MKKILADASGKTAPIEVVEIQRIEFADKPISASRVRALLKDENYEELASIVPSTTYDFLMEGVE